MKKNTKDLFDLSHNPSHSTLYPDVLKIKTIIVVKQIFAKMPFVYLLQIHNLATLLPWRPSCRVVRNGFVNLWIINKWPFLQSFVSQQFLFLFSKHLDTMSNSTDCWTGRIDLWLTLSEIIEGSSNVGYLGFCTFCFCSK